MIELQIDRERNRNLLNANPNLNKNKSEKETIVTVRLPRTYYRSACAVAHLSGYSFEEYVNRAIRQKIKMELDGHFLFAANVNSNSFSK